MLFKLVTCSQGKMIISHLGYLWGKDMNTSTLKEFLIKKSSPDSCSKITMNRVHLPRASIQEKKIENLVSKLAVFSSWKKIRLINILWRFTLTPKSYTLRIEEVSCLLNMAILNITTINNQIMRQRISILRFNRQCIIRGDHLCRILLNPDFLIRFPGKYSYKSVLRKLLIPKKRRSINHNSKYNIKPHVA
jgi:hypothetical protein